MGAPAATPGPFAHQGGLARRALARHGRAMREIASFWAGDRLGPIETASARSFLRQGHRLTVYSPAPIANLPEGVEGRDAAEVMPSDRILVYRREGTPSIHANLFRYALLARTEAVWVDLDLLALRPLDIPGDWIFGWESERHVNNAVLRLPLASATLRALLALGPDTVGFPDYLRGLERAKLWLRTLGRGTTIDRWPWGATGPKALTHALRQTGEIRHALPVAAFYAVPAEEAGRWPPRRSPSLVVNLTFRPPCGWLRLGAVGAPRRANHRPQGPYEC